jgi:hypothetical protein
MPQRPRVASVPAVAAMGATQPASWAQGNEPVENIEWSHHADLAVARDLSRQGFTRDLPRQANGVL